MFENLSWRPVYFAQEKSPLWTQKYIYMILTEQFQEELANRACSYAYSNGSGHTKWHNNVPRINLVNLHIYSENNFRPNAGLDTYLLPVWTLYGSCGFRGILRASSKIPSLLPAAWGWVLQHLNLQSHFKKGFFCFTWVFMILMIPKATILLLLQQVTKRNGYAK